MSEQIETSEFVAETPAAVSAEAGTPEAAPSPVNLADDALVEIKVGGETKLLPWKEARTGFMLHGDYTRKQQALAKERAEFDGSRTEVDSIRAQVEQRQKVLESVLSDPNKLSALVMAAAARRNAAPADAPPAPPQPLTNADLPSLEGKFAQVAQAQIAEFIAQQRTQVQEQHLTQDITTYTSELLKDSPVLSTIPGMDDKIYQIAAEMGPKNIEEAKRYINVVVDDFKARIAGAMRESSKQAALTKSKAASGIEPKGGAPVVRAPKKYNDVTDDDILAHLDAITR